MDVDENQIKIDILAYFSASNTTQECLVDYSSENSNLCSISPVTINPQDAKQKDNRKTFHSTISSSREHTRYE